MKNLTIVILIVALFGCSTMLSSTESIGNIVIANEQMKSGQVSETIKSVALSQTETLTVDHAINKYAYFSEVWKQKALTLDANSTDFMLFITQYQDMIKQYNSVKEIVKAHWDEYPHLHQAFLKEYEYRAEKIDGDIQKLITVRNTHKAISDAIMLATTLAGVVLR